MYLILFITFLVISLVLIALGFYKTEHTELSLVGFLFLFLLSLVVLNGQIQYKTGIALNYGCLCCGYYTDQERGEVFGAINCTETDNSTLVVISNTDIYETFDSGGTLSHIVGYWLAIASLIGFIAVLIGLKNTNWGKDNEF